MAENVQWIRLIVGMFDGNSFKKIKRAKIGGVSYRDKLTAVWFELLDLAGKCNSNGCLIDNNEIAYQSYEDIATMLDRDEKEIELCMNFFINEKMVEIIDDVYCLTNFLQYQNQEGLEKIREQKRLRQARWRERKALGLVDDVDAKASTQASTKRLLSNSISNSNSIYNDYNFSTTIIESIEKWLKYKKEKRQTYKETGLKTLLNKIQKDIKDKGEAFVVESIEFSIMNNYSGIYPPKAKEEAPKPENPYAKFKIGVNI